MRFERTFKTFSQISSTRALIPEFQKAFKNLEAAGKLRGNQKKFAIKKTYQIACSWWGREISFFHAALSSGPMAAMLADNKFRQKQTANKMKTTLSRPSSAGT
jgi:hypothetical protein